MKISKIKILRWVLCFSFMVIIANSKLNADNIIDFQYNFKDSSKFVETNGVHTFEFETKLDNYLKKDSVIQTNLEILYKKIDNLIAKQNIDESYSQVKLNSIYTSLINIEKAKDDYEKKAMSLFFISIGIFFSLLVFVIFVGFYIYKKKILFLLKNTQTEIQLIHADTLSIFVKMAELREEQISTSDKLLNDIDIKNGYVIDCLHNISELLQNIQNSINKDFLITEPKNGISNINLTAYNDAVSRFILINDHIYSLKKYRKYFKPFFKFLATQEITKDDVIASINRANDIPDDKKEEFIIIANDISNFVNIDISTINNYLQVVNLSGYTNYFDCIRVPFNQIFEEDKDIEALGEFVPSNTLILNVLKLGYIFPQSTIAPYREKSIVLI